MRFLKWNTEKKIKTVSILLFLVMVVNIAPDSSFNEWDRDSNDKISEEEFQTHFTDHYYSDWDMNNDQYLDDEDFFRMTFKVLDTDNNEQLDFSESKWGYDYLYGDYVDYEVSVNQASDSEIDYRTFYRFIYQSDFYTDFDSDNDGHLNEEELAEAMFTTWDIDGNGTLSVNEFRTFSDLYLQSS